MRKISCRSCLLFLFFADKKRIALPVLVPLDSFDLASWSSESRKRYTLRLLLLMCQLGEVGNCSAWGSKLIAWRRGLPEGTGSRRKLWGRSNGERESIKMNINTKTKWTEKWNRLFTHLGCWIMFSCNCGLEKNC